MSDDDLWNLENKYTVMLVKDLMPSKGNGEKTLLTYFAYTNSCLTTQTINISSQLEGASF